MDPQNAKVGPTLRHQAPKPFEFAVGDSVNIEAIGAHIERHIGKVATVFHELVSDKVHIDVHIVPPSAQRPYYTLVTSGMSDRPMTAPAGAEDFAHAELCLCLPPDWPMGDAAWKLEENYWPIRALKFLARFPHDYGTWLAYGHTIPNGDPPAPLAGNTRLSSFVLLTPTLAPDAFHELSLPGGKTIRFYALVPLHEDELDAKMRKGAEHLHKLLLQNGHSELLAPGRPSCVLKPRGLFSRLFGRN